MKIAVSGKGGVGKTTVSATLAHLYAQESRKVIAADVDPDANLGLALGFPEEVLDEILPISAMRKMISERTNASPDRTFYKLNPKVNDLVDLYGKEYNGVRLIALGTVETAGGGCVCPENTMLRMLLMDLVLAKKMLSFSTWKPGWNTWAAAPRPEWINLWLSSNREPEVYRPTKI